MKNIIFPYKGIMPKIDDSVFVAPNVAIIGDVKIEKDSSIWYGCSIRGDVNDIKIGNRTNIQDNTVIHVTTDLKGTYIGDDVTIGHSAVLHACDIHDFGFVGMKSCIMDGAIVENFAMVAAGSLVTPNKVVKSYELWAGSPARFVRKLKDEEIEYIKWSAPHYVELGKEHKKTLSSCY